MGQNWVMTLWHTFRLMPCTSHNLFFKNPNYTFNIQKEKLITMGEYLWKSMSRSGCDTALVILSWQVQARLIFVWGLAKWNLNTIKWSPDKDHDLIYWKMLEKPPPGENKLMNKLCYFSASRWKGSSFQVSASPSLDIFLVNREDLCAERR